MVGKTEKFYRSATLILAALIVGLGITIDWVPPTSAAEGPVTNGANIGVTADNGRLRIYGYATSGQTGPVTALANLGLKADDGRLSVVMVGGVMTPDTLRVGDGTALLPAYSFSSEPTLGFWRSSAGNITFQATRVISSGRFSAAIFSHTGSNNIQILPGDGGAGFNFINPGGGSVGINFAQSTGAPPEIRSGNGLLAIANSASTIGGVLKVDALPTIASGFGTAPAVTAGSTPFAGSVNVGTGVPGTGGVVAFNGTAFPSAPFVVCMNQTTLMAIRCTATTTQLTIAATALTASDIVNWVAISSK